MKLLAAIVVSAVAASPSFAATAPSSVKRGKTMFVAACGSCHTLAAAKTRGRNGPNLGEEQRSYGDVIDQVVFGGGGMPAFGKSLTKGQIKDIATFVAHATATAPADG